MGPVGGNAPGLKTDGRTVVFPRDGRANNRQVSNLFNSLGHALGDPDLNHFGLEFSTRIAPGPSASCTAEEPQADVPRSLPI
ncbi:hypothetical protein ACLEPN_11445 [Myxococcus sp. 1LA]